MNEAVTIIVPTYNERENILPLVERIHKALAKDYAILFVDDNSRDGTGELISELSSRYPVSVLVRRDKRGLASAVVDGLKQANGAIVAVMDADLQHPPELMPELVARIRGGAEMAIASRYVAGGSCRGWGLTRRIISRGAITLAHILLPFTRRIKDPMSGYFAFVRDGVDCAELKPAGYKILLEVLAQGNFRSVTEVPFTFDTRSRGESKLKVKTQVDYLKHILSLMRRTGEIARFIKFIMVGVSGVGVNLGMQWLLTRRAGLADYSALATSIEVSILTNFILNDNITFRDRRMLTPRATLWRLAKYNMVALPGAAINWGVALALIRFAGVPDLLANFIGIVLATVWNYILSTIWAWK